jgi:glucose/arabinose dehydrogenase
VAPAATCSARRLALLPGLLACGLAVAPAAAADVTLVRVASDLSRPLYVTAPPADAMRLFIVEQFAGTSGRVRILDLATGSLLATPFLSVPDVSTGGEQGLLGLAFHPDYASNGYFYVDLTNSAGDTEIRRYSVSGDPDVADAGSATLVLGIDQPDANHNGGWLGFGPDGYLYIATGDGGGADDSGAGHTAGTGNAQDITDNLLGKLLRIDVDGDDFPSDATRNYAIPPDNPFVGGGGDDEIWAYGLRNPFRASFDRATGDLYIGDVGQGSREEIDVQPAASAGGENYGWRLREGTIATPTGGVGGDKPAGAIDPIYDYPHGGGDTEGFVVTGGYVYRGPIVAFRGRYVFADFANARIWTLRWDGSDPAGFDGTNFTEFIDWGDSAQFVPDAGTLSQISSFGEDDAGNLYIVSLGGDVFRMTPLPAPVPSSAPTPLALLAVALGLAGWRASRARKTPARCAEAPPAAST